MEKRARRAAAGNRRSKAGETLTETLVAMLIVGLSSVLFLTMTGASGRIFRRSEAEYDLIYDKITAAGAPDSSSPVTESIGGITVKGESASGVTVDVEWYGNTDYVLSYQVK